MTHLLFYIQYSWRDLTRNGRRTAFALFCVAAGVAAIVALRTLALSIGDTLVNNLAGTLHGDAAIQAGRTPDSQFYDRSSIDNRTTFSDTAMKQIGDWAKANNVQITGAINGSFLQITPPNGSLIGRIQVVSSHVIDPAVYPFYDAITALDPAGVPLSQLLTSPTDVVVSKTLADTLKLNVGDLVNVSRTSKQFTVKGIIPASASGLNIAEILFGSAYFGQQSVATLQLNPLPDTLYLKVPSGASIDTLIDDLYNKVGDVGRVDTTTTALKSDQQLADIIDRLIVAMGLIALLIGGIGIINTMQVVVRRRTLEIAVLKTIGVKGGQITILFLVEAIIMGVLGAILGDLLGMFMSVGVLAISQRIWVQTLVWHIYPQALETGFVFGILVTAIFGFLPTLIAARVRPSSVLRPNEIKAPVSGLAQTLIALIVVILGVGWIVGSLLNNVQIGIIGVAITMIILGLFVGLFYLIVLVLVRLPAFGNVDLRLALRGIGSQRFRSASTLLTLTAGIFALSTLLLASLSVPTLLNIGFENVLGGNVLIFSPIAPLRLLVNAQLNSQTGVQHYEQIALYTGSLTAVNGDTAYMDKLAPNVSVSAQTLGVKTGRGNPQFNSDSLIAATEGTISGHEVTAKGYQAGTAISGRTLNAGDAGKQVVVLRQSAFTDSLGIKPGDKMTYDFSGHEVTFTVVGILSASSSAAVDVGQILGSGSAPIDSFPAEVSTPIQFTVAQVDTPHLNTVLGAVSAVPGVFAFDVGFFDSLIQKLLQQFTTIPIVVVILSLLVVAVIIANTVSLATIERRREIGVMKAIGLKGTRVMGILTIENGIIGLLAGLIGTGIGVLGIAIVSSLSGVSVINTVSWGSVVLLLALSIAITVVATWISAYSTMNEKPLNVLRYE